MIRMARSSSSAGRLPVIFCMVSSRATMSCSTSVRVTDVSM
jgi:hypothetical protein